MSGLLAELKSLQQGQARPEPFHDNTGFAMQSSAGPSRLQDRPALPSSEELLSLLQKQDSVISELFGELEVCKQEVTSVKEHSLATSRENRRLFEELKSLITDQAAVRTSSPVPTSGRKVENEVVSTKSCEQCLQLQEKLEHLEGQTSSPRLQKESKEVWEKLREAVAMAEEAEAGRAEAEGRARVEGERREAREKELAELRAWAHKEMLACKEAAHQDCIDEAERLKSLNNKLNEELAGSKAEAAIASQRASELKQEKEAAEDRLGSKEKDLVSEISQLRQELSDSRVEIARLESKAGDLQQRFQMEHESHKQQLELAKETAAELKSLLVEAKEEAAESREASILTAEKNTSLENQVWKLKEGERKWKSELEKERKEKQLQISHLTHSAQEREVSTQTELQQLLKTQKKLAEKLRGECEYLTNEIERKNKIHRQEVKQLKKEKLELTVRLERLLATSDS